MIHPLPFAEEDLLAYSAQVGAPDTNAAAELLARAIAVSPSWRRFPPCRILVRRSPAALAVVGELSPANLSELRVQAAAASRRLQCFRYVSFAQAEHAVAVLAERLRPFLDRADWAGCRFAAIPRGGLIVLGMLAAALNLPPERLEPSADPRLPLVLVDDCVLTGVRLREQLEKHAQERILVAHLYSHPCLRQAVLETEPRARECLAAFDLGDDTASQGTPRPEAIAERAYWAGAAEFIAFAWSEPDRTVSSPQLPSPIAGWKLLAPEHCLKHRSLAAIPVEVQRCGKGPLRPSPESLFIEEGASVTLASQTGGDVVRLEGAAAAAWKALLDTGSMPLAEQRLAEYYEVEAAVLHRDLAPVWADLRRRGFLQDAVPENREGTTPPEPAPASSEPGPAQRQ